MMTTTEFDSVARTPRLQGFTTPLRNTPEPAPAAHGSEICATSILAVKDALEALNGRWKVLILLSLTMGAKRFKQISRDLQGITDKMLSKELKDLEANQLVKRTVYDSFPPAVEYTITEHGSTLGDVILVLGNWGMAHRHKIIGK